MRRWLWRFTLCSLVGAVRFAGAAEAAAEPDLVFWNARRLASVKADLASGGAAFKEAFRKLQSEADEAQAGRPPSVMDKTKLPPGGDKHDYVSQALYWWPDPSKPDGLPYIQKDGQANPEVKTWKDRDNLRLMAGSVEALALAYHLTGKASYAGACAAYLRVWFLDPATRMNPHLDYAQFVPGVNDGRGTGLIETRELMAVPDAVALLAPSSALGAEEVGGLRAWFAAYFRWFRDSRNGKEEAAARNNHGTFYDAQAIAFALFAGLPDTARALASASRERRIAEQIEPDGRQPEELKRTQALHYVAFNLEALLVLGFAARRCGVDFWTYATADGRSLRKAMDWARPYLLGDKPWTWQQIEPFETREAMLDFLMAADGFSDAGYWEDAARVKGVSVATEWASLIYHTAHSVGLSRHRFQAKRDAGGLSAARGFDGLGRIRLSGRFGVIRAYSGFGPFRASKPLRK